MTRLVHTCDTTELNRHMAERPFRVRFGLINLEQEYSCVYRYTSMYVCTYMYLTYASGRIAQTIHINRHTVHTHSTSHTVQYCVCVCVVTVWIQIWGRHKDDTTHSHV